MSHPTQILVLLDAESMPVLEEITACLPHEREERVILRYSEAGGPAVTRHGDEATPVDWNGVAASIAALSKRAREVCSKARTSVQVFIAGRAPLSAFVQLGYELSAWSEPQTLLNRRKDGTWDVLALQSSEPTAEIARFFDGRAGIPLPAVAEATGRVVVFASTIGMPEAPKVALRETIRSSGDDVAGFVELRTSDNSILDDGTAPIAAQEIAEAMSQIPGSYPYHSGLAVAVGGPATLAFLLGRGINANIHSSVAVAEYCAPGYEIVFELPWRSRIPVLSSDPEDVAARGAALQRVMTAVEDLQSTLVPGDFAGLLPPRHAEVVIERLKSLTFAEPAGADAFRLSILLNQVAIGSGLVEVLRALPEEEQSRIAHLLLVHEIRHFDQNIQSTNYMEIGRAGVALEEADFWADVFSLSVIARWHHRTVSQSQDASFRNLLVTYVNSLLLGLAAFDRAEQGSRITRLAERRLRRYLIWQLQRSRAATVKSVEDMDSMFSSRLIAELAPLRGSLDSRWDKMADGPLPQTELVVVFGGDVKRFHRQPGFEPASLVDAVRRFADDELRAAMDFVVSDWHECLTPWAATKLTGKF